MHPAKAGTGVPAPCAVRLRDQAVSGFFGALKLKDEVVVEFEVDLAGAGRGRRE